MTTAELANALLVESTSMTCDQLDYILRQLVESETVILAGIHTICYVARVYADSWCLPVLSSVADGQIVSSTKRVPPRQWYDIYGRRDEHIWWTCQRAVIDAILYRPGVQEDRLLRQLNAAFTYVELRSVLDYLITINAITRRYLIMPQNVGLFSKAKPYYVSDTVTLQSNAIPCYWASVDCYTLISTS
ncbi:hypothetical protein BDF19DRAFT_285080 [Syncephalis fuscata]|nr:hypothetical protein BDF19DRAFT_285080 [Syncephalis fuscata]